MGVTQGTVGTGSARQHHGELFQGSLYRNGEWVSCLITMPGRGVGSTARFWPRDDGDVEVVPAWKKKARRAALLALGYIGVPLAGKLEIQCTVATGVGLGSSTADVVAAIRAVSNAYGTALDVGTVARLAVAAEGASDPIMFDGEMVLFAQREGRLLESFGSWVPPYAVMSFDTDPAAEGVDTLSMPVPSYGHAELAAFESLVRRAREAFRQRDAQALAVIATESAALNQRILPLRNFDSIRRLADESGALGLQISHSGTIAGLLFDGRLVRADTGLEAAVTERLRSLGARPLGLFRTGGDL